MKKNRTREERALRYAAALLRLTVLLWIAVLLLCLLEPGCPAVTWLAAVGAGWLTWRGMALVLKLDEPRRKRGVRR